LNSGKHWSKTINFLSSDTLKAWTGTPFRKCQVAQLQDWGYKQGRDFWIRRAGGLAVKAELLHSNRKVDAPTEPDFSCFATQETHK
jgi:hypothetical protein